MKYIITSLSVLFLVLTINGQSTSSCKDFHTGKFMVEGDASGVIKRTKKFQIEKSHGITTKDKVVWLSECKYKLIPIKVRNDEQGMVEDWITFFEIIETGEDFYIVRITNDHNDYTLYAKVIKLK